MVKKSELMYKYLVIKGGTIMEMSSRSGQRFYLVSGLFFLVVSGLLGTATLGRGVFPVGHELILFGISIMSLCLSYLYPQFKGNDERTKRIREKGMYYSYLLNMTYMIIMMGLFQFNVININGYQTICLLATVTIITVSLSFVVLSQRF